MQPAQDDAPCAEEKVPGLQLEQAETDVAIVTAEKRPAKQSVQLEAPAPDQVPALQVIQDAAFDAEKVPATQFTQEADATEDIIPATQLAHTEAPLPAYVPPPHCKQVAADVAAKTAE